MALYNYQRLQSNRWGRNTLTIEDFSRGDKYVLLGCAFVRFPNNSYAKVGNIIEYEFHCAIMDPHLGLGVYHGGEMLGEAWAGDEFSIGGPGGPTVNPYGAAAGAPINPVAGSGPVGPRRPA
jgi:hypothetical protein